MHFDHVGVLVDDLDQAKAFARDVLGLGEPVSEFQAPEHGLAGAFFGLGEGRLEFFTLEETDDARRPQGTLGRIDHVAVRVEDLEAERDRLAGQGVRFRGPASDQDVSDPIELRGARHLWTDPASSGGVAFQLIEPPDA